MSCDDVIFEIELPEYDRISEDGRILEFGKEIKLNNEIWRIHKSDPDKIFPSNFHADRVDAAEKLDIYNGCVYCSKTKKYIRRLPNKVMRVIYGELEASKEEEIRNKIAQKDKFSYFN